jgi:hypothetical protein
MSTNREKIGLAGLLFLHFLQESPFYKDTGNSITKMVKDFTDQKPSTIADIKKIYESVNDPIAKNMAKELLRLLIAGDSKKLIEFNFIANTIYNLYDLLTKSIVPNKSSTREITGTIIPMPGDIVSFLKIIMLSMFDDEVYREIEIFLKYTTTVDPNNTIRGIKKFIKDQRLTPIILNTLIPNESTIGAGVTENLDKKIKIIQGIQGIIGSVPP